jgi:hypothetical protein
VTAYGAAWRRGEPWPRDPNPIPIAYVTNAGMLWKKGEVYRYDGLQSPPMCWSSGASRKAQARAAIRAARTFGSMRCVAGVPVAVTIAVTPGAGSASWAVEERVPAGWGITGISHGGAVARGTNTLRWGPFCDAMPRRLTYVAVPCRAAGRATFGGLASVDGSVAPISGASALSGR